MISRRTTFLIAELYTRAFRELKGSYDNRYYRIDTEAVYDFLFVNDYPAWFCNIAKAAHGYYDTRPFTEFILKVHTGESLVSATLNWTWPQREKLGQQFLKELAEDIFKFWAQKKQEWLGREIADTLAKSRQNLELDGYAFRGDTLLAPEEDVLDVKEETGVLQDLYRELRLPNEATVFHHLALSEEHYLAQRWDDSISNSRKFLEAVLQEVAAGHYSASLGAAIPEDVYSRPARVRDYLESGGLLESKEKQALSSVYGLLSETGGHPYMAQSEQARLLRHLALTLAQFALLRLQGFKKGA